MQHRRPLFVPSPRVSVLGGVFFLAACGSSDPADAGPSVPEASVDAPAVDAALPPDSTVTEEGDRGAILRVGERARFELPTLEGDVQVVFTEADVPHIYAANDRDLRVVEGFLVARERFGQLELYRRYGLGELAQLFGDVALSIDASNRALGRTGFADRLLTLLSAEEEESLDAFVEGVNAYIAAVDAGLAPPPAEHATLRPIIAPRARNVAAIMRPFTRRDLAGIAATIVYFFGFDDGDLRTTLALDGIDTHFAGDPFEALRRDGVRRDIVGRVDPVHPITSAECASPPCYGIDGRDHRIARAPRVLPVESGTARRALRELDRFASMRGGVGADIGSNAWAVDGAHTADGRSLLAGDGHLPLQTAPLFFQAAFDTRLFGDDATGLRAVGMLLPGVVPMGPGTNGHIAWSQTYQEADVVDWYREEIVLDGTGRIAATRFRGADRPIVRHSERYEIADVPVFMSEGRTLELDRFETFDGRHIVSVEGDVTTDLTAASTVYVGGEYITPRDANGDGHIEAISLDYVIFDGSNMLRFLFGLERAETVDDAHDATATNIGYTQNLVISDAAGGILYTAYNATPCRSDLRPTGMTTGWATGAHPRFLIDGTSFGGFEIATTSAGLPDESRTGSACLIPRDAWPEALRPTRGYVLSANNDLGGTSLDGDLDNDRHYVGGPWDPGYRANTIHTRLAAATAGSSASIADMQALQGEHHSQLGLEYTPALRTAITAGAAAAAAISPGADELRLATAYRRVDDLGVTDVIARLEAWRARGANAASGVETFYDAPTATDRDDAVATMIFNEWFRRFTARVLGDEDIADVIVPSERQRTLNTLHRFVIFRGTGAEARRLASWNEATGESIFFDTRGTAPVERADEQILLALGDAIEALRSAPSAPGVGGFGTNDVSQWLWGLRHQVRFESVLKVYAGEIMGLDLIVGPFAIDRDRIALASNIPAGDPRASLTWFPRPGDQGAVDAAPAGFGVDADYTYAYGPNMRMVIALGAAGVEVHNVLPGGQSGLPSSTHFDDQARLWLANRAMRVPYEPSEVAAGAIAREWFHAP